jgi:hypothetical protein
MRNTALLLVLLMSSGNQLQASEHGLGSLESLQWKHRVLLVYAQEPSVRTALSNLEAMAPDIEERDLAWFLFAKNEVHTNHKTGLDPKLHEQLLERYFAPAPAENRVILIGKDGGVKSKGPDLDLEALFDLIDQMPMRKAEMRRAGAEPD